MTVRLDFETYSEAGCVYDAVARKWHGPPGATKKGLPVVGAAVYAEHPTTEVLTASYNLGAGVRRWRPSLPPPADLFDYLRGGGLLNAWNSGFEWWIWNLVCTRRYGWPALTIEQTRCSMAKARASGLPGKLGIAGEVLNLPIQKDKRGDALLKKFSMPRNPTQKDARLRIRPEEDPEGEALYQYCDMDTDAEAAIAAVCPDLDGDELAFWLADQHINRRGVHVDRPSLLACVSIVEQCLETFDAELSQLTGGTVERASQLARLQGWLAAWGMHMAAMDEEAITAQLERMPPHPPGVQHPPRRALEIRQLAGSASVKKVFAMANQLSSRDRLHDLFNYHGAHTGRPTGEGPQPTNLPKAGPKVRRCGCGRYAGTHHTACPWCAMPVPPGAKRAEWGAEATEDALEVIRTRSVAAVQWYYGDAMLTVSGCLRGLFVAAPGKELIASDFSAIESVVTACLAGEDWRVEMFREHGKNYEMSASQISGIPFAEVMAHAGYDVTEPQWWLKPQTKPHHPRRQDLGKVAELASGFGGWIGAWKAFGADEFMGDDEIKAAILAWRDASPAIVHFWGALEAQSIAAVQCPGQWMHAMRLDGSHSGVSFCCSGPDALYCHLPSGRNLTYRNPRLQPSGRNWGPPWSLSYERYNTNPKYGPIGWGTVDQWGGKWCENVVQAVARDIQREAILNLERGGYPVVLHVYDEDVTEVPIGWGSIAEHEAHMARLPAWAIYKGERWPIKVAGGWRGKRYRKA